MPNGDTTIFPCDKLQIIGNDEQTQKFNNALQTELVPEDLDIEKREMKLRQLVISGKSEFCGKTLGESGIRDKYDCMVVGLEEGEWRSMEHVQICGLMMMASNTDDTEQIAREFDTAARFFDEVKAKYFADDDAFCERSWGMSHDYPIAIQHGATLVRVGTAIFGPRIY